jgi:hypothetical protein
MTKPPKCIRGSVPTGTTINISIARGEGRDWITDREVVDNLSLFGCEIETMMHLIIVKRVDACCPQPER